MRVLIATDGSPSAAQAVALVAGVPWPAGTDIQIVEAVETSRAIFGGPWGTSVIVEDDIALHDELVRMAGESVERARARCAAVGLACRATVLQGRPATVIVEAASAMDADLVVVGSRGRGTIESMVLGSVSAEVVGQAASPVLVARGSGIARIVLAWDGSEHARRAASLLTAWPIFGGSAVRVVSVTDTRVPWWSGFPETGTPTAMPIYLDAAEAARRAHDTLATEMAAELRANGIDAEPEHREGDAATQIIAAAEADRADLIVMGTHGRTGLTRLVAGSVARNVLHHAPCSVLVTRPPRDGR